MASAGRILIIPKGEWEEEKEYKMLDLVTHKGNAFLSKKTSLGIEPTTKNEEYWFALLNIEKVIEESIANVIEENVADILSERIKGEAKYASDLLINFTEATFVRWDSETKNTPYKADLTECTEGFALVCGDVSSNHTVVSWAIGGEVVESFVHYICKGEDKSWKSSLQDFNDFAKQTNVNLEKKANLSDIVRFPDFSNIIKSGYTAFQEEGGYTLEEDGWLVICFCGSTQKFSLAVDGNYLVSKGSIAWSYSASVPVKKGQTITVGESNATGIVTLYGVL